MKALGLALIAALAIGCSATPTSPSLDSGNAAVLTEQDHKPNPASTTHTITLYFLVNGLHAGRRPVELNRPWKPLPNSVPPQILQRPIEFWSIIRGDFHFRPK